MTAITRGTTVQRLTSCKLHEGRATTVPFMAKTPSLVPKTLPDTYSAQSVWSERTDGGGLPDCVLPPAPMLQVPPGAP